MQWPGHLILSYVTYQAMGGKPEYLAPMLIASVIVDLDHIVPILKQRRILGIRGSEWRSSLHELLGVSLFSTLSLGAWFQDHDLGIALALGFIMHYVLDFLVGQTRPFYPYSNTQIQVLFEQYPHARTVLEIALCAVAIFVMVK